jgi:hypothetical protein
MTDIAINPVTRRVQFTGNTGTGPYAFTFNILQSSDITVYKNNALFTLTTDYTVSIASNGTGSVTTVVALISSDILTIIGGRQLSRTTDFVTAGDLLASSLNEQLDSNVIMSQQLDERFDRSMKAQPGDTNANMNLPLVADRANGFLTFDNSGNVAINTIQNLDLLNLVQLNIGNITIEGDTVSTSSGNGLALSSGDDLEFVVPASNARIYFKRATATAIDWALAGSSSSLRFINNQSGGVFASITSTHLTSSSSTLELRSEGAALTLNSGGSTIPLEYDGTQRGYLKLDTADTIKFYTGTGTGTLSTTISGDDLTVVGAISKGSGSFKIDHPIPSKKDTHHLVHSFLEGPQADLIYRGVVNLVGGSASVNIDTAARMTTGTFVLLCGNVQSFTSNESGWTAVKSSVSGNTLTITAQDNTCTDSVSWMVVGERKDQHMLDTNWTDENGRVIVEPEKQMEE